MNLSESEEKFLLKLEKNLEKVYIVYISVAMSLGGAILCLIMGLVRSSEKTLNAAIFLAMLGISLFSTMHAYQKMFKIVSKMKQTIKDLEASK
jgi:hypothetical protein